MFCSMQSVFNAGPTLRRNDPNRRWCFLASSAPMKTHPGCDAWAPSPIQASILAVNVQLIVLNNFKGGQGGDGNELVRSDGRVSVRALKYRSSNPEQEATTSCSTGKESRMKLLSSKLLRWEHVRRTSATSSTSTLEMVLP